MYSELRKQRTIGLIEVGLFLLSTGIFVSIFEYIISKKSSWGIRLIEGFFFYVTFVYFWLKSDFSSTLLKKQITKSEHDVDNDPSLTFNDLYENKKIKRISFVTLIGIFILIFLILGT